MEEAELRAKQKYERCCLEHDTEREKWELERKRLENDLERQKQGHLEELRHLQESKRVLSESVDMEKEALRRDEHRKSQEELERVRRQFLSEQGESEKRHHRYLDTGAIYWFILFPRFVTGSSIAEIV